MDAILQSAIPALLKVRALRDALAASFMERQDEATCLMVALLAREHVLLLGPPGTGKSAITQSVAMALGGAYFERLLTAFTVPEELFGPYSIQGLQEDRYERKTAGYLPEAEVAFLDEALDLNTPIPTPGGWTTVGAIRVGDMVIGSDGLPTAVTRLTEIATDHQCYRLRLADGESIVADAGHLWLAKPARANQDFRVWTTAEMVSDGRTFWLPRCSAVDLPAADLPIEPYLLGVWLGNGNCWNGELYIRPEWVPATVAELESTGTKVSDVVSVNKRGTMSAIRLTESGFRKKLIDTGLIPSASDYQGSGKAVPPEYVRGSIVQRLRLLQGLMDTDGSMDKSGTCVFSNTNEGIVDAVVELLRSLGMRATKKPVRDDRVGTKGKHKQCWKVTFRADPEMRPFRVRPVVIPELTQAQVLRVETIESVDPVSVRCIEVAAEDHLFLAGRSFAVTHNCFKAGSPILNALLTLLNERAFDNGVSRARCPLEMCIGASNELPADGSLEALYDRFVLRRWVRPIADRDARKALLAVRGEPGVQVRLSREELEEARQAASQVVVPDAVLEALLDLHEALSRELGVYVSDRRLRKMVKLVQAHAALWGRTEATKDDILVLTDSIWSKPEERPAVHALVCKTVAPALFEATKILDAATELLGKVPAEVGLAQVKDLATANQELAKMATRVREMAGDSPRVLEIAGKIEAMADDIARRVQASMRVRR